RGELEILDRDLDGERLALSGARLRTHERHLRAWSTDRRGGRGHCRTRTSARARLLLAAATSRSNDQHQGERGKHQHGLLGLQCSALLSRFATSNYACVSSVDHSTLGSFSWWWHGPVRESVRPFRA